MVFLGDKFAHKPDLIAGRWRQCWQVGWIIRWIKRPQTLTVDRTSVEVIQVQTLLWICAQVRHGNQEQCMNEFKGIHK